MTPREVATLAAVEGDAEVRRYREAGEQLELARMAATRAAVLARQSRAAGGARAEAQWHEAEALRALGRRA